MRNRRTLNLEIINKLTEYLIYNPDMRFGQALRNLGIIQDKINNETHHNEWVNGFNEEPEEMLERIKKINNKGEQNE